MSISIEIATASSPLSGQKKWKVHFRRIWAKRTLNVFNGKGPLEGKEWFLICHLTSFVATKERMRTEVDWRTSWLLTIEPSRDQTALRQTIDRGYIPAVQQSSWEILSESQCRVTWLTGAYRGPIIAVGGSPLLLTAGSIFRPRIDVQEPWPRAWDKTTSL